EVGELRPELQAKLLRAVEDTKVRPVGADADVPVKVRLIAATSRDLEALVAKDEFRADLFYRLAGITLRVPPLRERPDDVIHLTLAFLRDEAAELGLSVRAAERLALGYWPGNVRELRHALAQAVLSLSNADERVLLPEHFPSVVTHEETKPLSLGV